MSLGDVIVDTDPKGRLRLGKQLDILTMSPHQRKKVLRNIVKQTKKDARTNIRQQKTVDGSKMPGRASKKKKRMFRKMAKGLAGRIKNDHHAVITWKNGGQARTAYRHHHGIDEKYTAARAKKKNGLPDYKAPATRSQAKALKKEGYRRRVARKRGKGGAILKKVSVKWIQENLTQGQAGLILRILRTGKSRGEQSWKVKVQKRPILGATQKDADKYLTAMANNALRDMNRA